MLEPIRLVAVVPILTLTLAPTAELRAQSPAAEVAPHPPRQGFRADYLMELDRLQARMMALAEAIPAERYAFRADPRVHSIGECFTESAAATRHALIGMEREAPPPPQGDEDQETGKERVVRDLEAVLASLRQAVLETSDQGLEAPIDYLGRRWTSRALFLLLLAQTHEALGHASAHAESLGILPPWVQKRLEAEASED